ncbi:hypothetical protein [Acidocella sp.]|uniref:hypothetical protein n=1 Tax=Acidocella sp. TaxID=50710 RepID=UPI00263093F9|nr:hypothetical protein [Acidocella sp.]
MPLSPILRGGIHKTLSSGRSNRQSFSAPNSGGEGARSTARTSPSLSAEQIALARQLTGQEGKPVATTARLFGVHRAILYRALPAVAA